MRTKTLLITAVLGLASAATSMAQVYSANVVGYVNTVLKPGFNMICNPLNSTNNDVSNIIPDPGVGTKIFKFNTPGGFNAIVENGGPGLYDGPMVLAPGEGFFIQVPALTTNTFVGEVLLGTTTNTFPQGFSLRASKVPQSAPLDGAGGMNFPAQAGDQIFFFSNPGGYGAPVESGGGGTWDAATPTPAVGQGFWINRAAAGTASWVRTFNIP